MKRFLLSILTILILGISGVKSQCDPTVPTFVVDLSSSPNATYTSPLITRAGNCCATGANCLEFIITLNAGATGILFNFDSGAMPPTLPYYQVDCGPDILVGTPVCLTGIGPFSITYCKPGGNSNSFTISSIAAPTVSGAITLNEGCSGTISATNYDPASVTWTSIYPGAVGTYDGFLSCPSGCLSTNVQSNGVFPPYVDYQVCGYPTGGCNATLICNVVRVYFNATLGVTIAANPPIICYGSGGTTLAATITGGSAPYNITWSTGATTNNTNSTTNSINITNGGTYSVSITDASGCPGVNTSINVIENTIPPMVNAGVDQKVCQDNFPIQLNGTFSGVDGVRWLGGGGTFSNVNSATSSYTPSLLEVNNGSVTLTLEGYFNSVCSSVFDQVTLYLSPNTISTNMVSSPGTLCYGQTSVNVNANISGGKTPYQSIVWNDGNTTNPRTASNGGTYTISITDDYGCVHQDAITINQILTQPLVSAGNDRTICVDNTAGGSKAIPLVGNTNIDGVIWSGGNGNFANQNSPTTIYIPSQSEINNRTVTLNIEAYYNGNICPSVYDQVTLTLASFSNQTALTHTDVSCYNYNNGSASLTFGADGPHTFRWITDGNSTANPINNLSAGTHSVRVTNSGGCVKTLDVVINQPAPLELNLIQKKNETCYESNDGIIEVVSSGGNSFHNYYINNNPTGKLSQNLVAGNYFMEVIDEKGCTDNFPETITQPNPLLLNTTVTDVNCFGEISGKIQTVASGGTAPYSSSILGFNGSYAEINNLAAGTYTIDVIDNNGCKYAQQAIVDQPDELLAMFTIAKDTFCSGEVISVNSNVSGGNPTYSYQWSNGLISGPFGYFYANQTEDLTMTVTDSKGCQKVYTDGYYVPTLNPVDFEFSISDNEICFGEEVVITAFYVGDNYPLNISWNNNFSGLGYHQDSPSGNTVYELYVTDKCNNQFSDTRPIIVHQLPVIDLPQIVEEGCSPLTVDFSKYPQSSNIVNYFWEFGNGTISEEDQPYVTFYDPGQFNLKLSLEDVNGCVNSKTAESSITVFPSPHSSPSASTLIVDEFSPIVQFYNKSYDNDSYTWDFGDGFYSSTEEEPVHKYKKSGTYTVELAVENDYGCKDKEYLMVEVQPVATIFVPSAFTPNNDNLNELFKAEGRNISENGFVFEVFNRWGQKVFQTNNLSEGWDGSYQGQTVPQGNYVYKIVATDVLGNTQELVGSVAVIR